MTTSERDKELARINALAADTSAAMRIAIAMTEPACICNLPCSLPTPKCPIHDCAPQARAEAPSPAVGNLTATPDEVSQKA